MDNDIVLNTKDLTTEQKGRSCLFPQRSGLQLLPGRHHGL